MTEPAGVIWVSRFPGSKDILDLAPPFRGDVQNLLQRLIEGRASVDVEATWRPEERAWLMHYACWVAGFTKDGQFFQMESSEVPAHSNIDIDWTCGGDRSTAIEAAKQMVAAYGIVFPASLTSNHIKRLAIDWKVRIANGATIRDAQGHPFSFSGAADQTDKRFHAIARTFGVLPLVTDPVHFSIDGH